MYDVFYLSHNEPYTEFHWHFLTKLVPHAKRVSGINGIHAAHRHCAMMARTQYLFVVDADNEVLPTFNFSFRVQPKDEGLVHLWYARNPANGLEYGWGGIKLFPTNTLKNVSYETLDMTTSFPLKVIPEVGSITRFDTSPFDAWRSAFRECVKLSQQTTEEAKHRLRVWTEVAKGPNAKWILDGAKSGAAYGQEHFGDREALLRINDFNWLKAKYQEIPDAP